MESRTFLTVFWLWMIRKSECAAEFPCGFLVFCTDFDAWGDGSFSAAPGAAEKAEIYFNYDAAKDSCCRLPALLSFIPFISSLQVLILVPVNQTALQPVVQLRYPVSTVPYSSADCCLYLSPASFSPLQPSGSARKQQPPGSTRASAEVLLPCPRSPKSARSARREVLGAA